MIESYLAAIIGFLFPLAIIAVLMALFVGGIGYVLIAIGTCVALAVIAVKDFNQRRVDKAEPVFLNKLRQEASDEISRNNR